MAGVRAARDTLSDTTGQVRDVSGSIVNISPDMVPFLKRVGVKGDAGVALKHEWQEDALFVVSTTLSATTSVSTTTQTTITLSGNNAFNFEVGSIILIGSEQMRVTAVGADDSFTVTRGWGSTTAAVAAVSATITKIGHAQLENADTTAFGTTVHDFPFNYFSLIDMGWKISYPELAVAFYNVADREDYEIAKLLKHAWLLIERMAFYGKRVQGTATVPSHMGGLQVFVTDNTQTAAVALTEKKINDLMDDIYQDVGGENMGKLIVCQSWQKRKISSFYSPMARMDRATRTGGVVVNVIDTDFGELDVLMAHNCPTGELFIINPEFVRFLPFRDNALFTEPLAIDGAYVKGHLWGMYSLEVKGDKAHGRMSGLTTS